MQLNCATELLDRRVAAGEGGRLCIQAPGVRWTYADLQAHANRIANVLVNEMGVVPGNRVPAALAQQPDARRVLVCRDESGRHCGDDHAAAARQRAGPNPGQGQSGFALCDARLVDELRDAVAQAAKPVQLLCFHDDTPEGLEAAMARQPATFTNVDTAADDTCLLAFTSGTTGVPKATMHFHRDILAICACWPPHVLQPRADDIFIGSLPMAFTFGLGGLLLFPVSVGAL
ncbi:AMP-binding protein [Cupriavidus basilensis]